MKISRGSDVTYDRKLSLDTFYLAGVRVGKRIPDNRIIFKFHSDQAGVK
jgi:hypothetical protein